MELTKMRALTSLFVMSYAEDFGKTESGKNRGGFVDALNFAMGVPLGSPWCASWVCARIKKAAKQFDVPIKAHLSASVMSLYHENLALIEQKPFLGAIMLMQSGESALGHCGIVSPLPFVDSFLSLEGNTLRKDATTRNGGEVALHTRKVGQIYGDLHILGFLRVF